MRLVYLLPLLAALASASQIYNVLVGPNATVPVAVNGSTISVNGSGYGLPQLPYTWMLFPSSAKNYLAIVGVNYPSSACQLTQAPESFSVSCGQNQPMTVVYVASPGYSLYCDQQPQSSQSRGPVDVLQFNSLRLNCRLVRGAAGVALSPSMGLIASVLGAVAAALGIAFAGLFLAAVLRQKEGEASSR
jgi:hypothetical protein